MMRLHWSPRSPFVRKVMIVLHECELLDEVALVRSVAIFHAPPNPAILSDNPLGKIPVLITEQGQRVFDSRVICEYLIERSNRVDMLPPSGDDRLRALTWQALGDGMTDILLLWRNEWTREVGVSSVLEAAFETKTRAVLAVLEEAAPELAQTPFGIGHVAIICALGQLDFRFAGCGWRGAYANLATWFDAMKIRPSVVATAIVDDGAGSQPDESIHPAFICETTS
jgi:glutathione S-transferase